MPASAGSGTGQPAIRRCRRAAFCTAHPQWSRQRPDPDGVRQALALWCGQLSPARRSDTRDYLHSSGLSDRVLLYLLTQQRVSSMHLSVQASRSLRCRGFRGERLVWSPDGRCLAHLARTRAGWSVQLWQQNVRSLEKVVSLDRALCPSVVVFAADSRSLQIADGSGHLELWQAPLAAGALAWRSAGLTRFYPQPVMQVILQSGRLLPGRGRSAGIAGFSQEQGRELAQTIHPGSGSRTLDWYQWQRKKDGALVFAGERHLLFTDTQSLVALYRENAVWKEQGIEPDGLGIVAPSNDRLGFFRLVASPCGKLFCRHLCGLRPARFCRESDLPCTLLGLWRFFPRAGLAGLWARHRGLDAWAAEEGGCGVSSGQRPADFFRCGRLRSQVWCVLSAFDRGHWRVTDSLPLYGADDGDEAAVPCSLMFNMTGSHFAALSGGGGVWIWQAAAAARWILVARIENGAGPGGFAFSPDGYHCALAGDDGAVSVWGACSGGRYARKVREYCGENEFVSQLTFSADGSRLILCSATDHGFFQDPVCQLWVSVPAASCTGAWRARRAIL